VARVPASAWPELTLAEPEPAAAAAAHQLRLDVRPERRGLQIVVDEHVVQPVESPRLDGQGRGAYACLDERHTLLAQRVQEWSPTTQDTSDG